MQRLRITYARGEPVKYVSHLDVMRFWERAFRRAHLPLALSQGFHPHPRISVAAPLAVGVTSEAEVMDVYLDEAVDEAEARARLAAQMVPGFEVLAVESVPEEWPSLQSLVRFAEYTVTVETAQPAAETQRVLRGFLARESVPWHHARDGEVRQYDLRAQVADLWLAAAGATETTLGMRLQNDGAASGRPEQVTRALGFAEPPVRIHRVRLVLERPPARPGAARTGRRNAGRRPVRKPVVS